MIKSILYATDRTENSAAALKYAYELSVRLGAKLMVYYGHELPMIRVSVSRPPQQIAHHVIKEQQEILTAYCTKHLGHLEGKAVECVVERVEFISQGILKKAKESEVGLIIIGRKDKHTERGLFVGDIGKGLQDKVPCPLLIVPNGMEEMAIKNILYASDFEEADIAAIKKIEPLAKALDAKISIAHISTEKEYAGKEQMEWFKDMLAKKVGYEKVEFKLIFSDFIEEKLKTHAEIIGADLLVVLEREEKGFFKRLFHKSLVKKIEDHISIPLLSYHKANL
ncbi:universal stress protein [Arenibacter sp. 6A1]|uniref:universal stress protein n=1 Tax=Arenibacter sp. 6A1 TaxID=2720391 RepID=UPI001445EF11|nr:universal stress protein [Arenibacter sp. 6A1]NKI25192.1 universal stress protein [Arenibacter sp. 6A1]